MFKDDIRIFFKSLIIPISFEAERSENDGIDFNSEMNRFTLINPENIPDRSKSLIELGYTEYIERILKYWLRPTITTISRYFGTYSMVSLSANVCMIKEKFECEYMIDPMIDDSLRTREY